MLVETLHLVNEKTVPNAFCSARIISHRIEAAFQAGPSSAMSWDYFRPASHSEGCSPQCIAPGSNSLDAAAWLPPPPALHPSPQSDREKTRHSKNLSSAASSSR